MKALPFIHQPDRVTQKTSKIVTDTSKNNGSFKSLFRSLLRHPYHYANDSVSVKPLSLICITSDLFEGYFPPSEAEKSIFLLSDKTEFKHLTLPFTHSEIVNFMEDLAVITALSHSFRSKRISLSLWEK